VPADGGHEDPGHDDSGRDDAGRQEELDDAFARIVADWDRPPDAAGAARWPVQEDLDADPPDYSEDTEGTEETEDTGRGVSHDGSRVGGFTLSLGPAPGTPVAPRAGAVPWDDEGHFVPPHPPPLPRPTGARGAAWVALLAGLLGLLLATILGWQLPTLLTAACIVGFVGGVAFLIVDMDDGDGTGGSGWDNGAQV